MLFRFDEPSQRCDLPENSNCVVTTTTGTTTQQTIPTPPTNDPVIKTLF
jgi:hypothetical protein